MVQSKYFNKEFNLILKLLFEKKQISKKLFKGYNYEKIISISEYRCPYKLEVYLVQHY